MKSRVRVFSNRIEFKNPGGFPRPVEELKQVDVSMPRNPVIAKLFRNVKLAENAGYGFEKMLQWEKSTNTKLLFTNEIDRSIVTFDIEKATDLTSEHQMVDSGMTSGMTISLVQNQIVSLIESNGLITYPQMAAELKINISAIQKHIAKLKKLGIIKRVGADFGGKWVILQK
ncbi:hypothetical protein FACS1894201_10730 [Bacteroidia bacterium]|nr:hypothetical protein FACS1894201_10730 [Bacteroidia bacterium]